jgi:ankyrin repeat protein
MDARLPLNPNLGFYRKSAKELKRAIAARDAGALARLVAGHPRYQGESPARAAEGGVSLKDAQLVIAREHGFATWAEFKTAVEKAAASPQPKPADRLLAAIKAGDGEAVRELLASAPALAVARDSEGLSPLVEACDRGLMEMVRLLLDAGADARQQGALEAAAHAGPHKMRAALDVVKLLIERGAPNDFYTHAMLGLAEDIRRDLATTDVNTPGPSGATALDLAAGNGHVEAVRLLLDAGATPSAALWRRVFLHTWSADYREIARMLVDRGAPCTFKEACEIGHAPAARRLLAANPELKDRPGPFDDLPMNAAILRGDVELARVLLEAGAADPRGQGRALVDAEPQRGKNLTGALYRNCTFDNANFQSCSFEGVVLHDVDLSGMRISFANLKGVSIGECGISGMTIWGIEVEPLLAQEQRRRAAEKKKG